MWGKRKHIMRREIIYLWIFTILTLGVGVKSIRAGDTVYVKWDATGNNDGSSWEDAFTNLEDALGIADSGDQIWVAQGVYFPTDNPNNQGVSFTLKNNVALYGGFEGYESSLDERDWETNITVLSGDIDHNDITDSNGVVIDPDSIVGNNSFHVVKADSIDSTGVLDGFVITAGNACDQIPNESGGGMYIYYGNPKLSNCTFSGNKANQKGGGMYNIGGTIVLVNCEFFMNRSYIYGGGIYSYSGNLTMENCVFKDNIAYYGGGAYNENSDFKLINCTFDGNWTDYGGGLYNTNTSSILINCTFYNNITGFGGGVYNDENSSCKLIGCILISNYAFYGGGVYNYGGGIQLINCSISSNISQVEGGGLYNENSNPILVNCVVTENGTIEGGGIFNKNSTPILINCTFYHNGGSYSGGGMHNDKSNPILTNCIFWGDYALHRPEIYNHLSTPVISHCDIEGCGGSENWDPSFGVDGGGNIDLYPLFADTANSNLHLQAGSPAIDAGNNDALHINTPPPGDTIDLAGNPRIVDGNQDGVAVIDMGAFEYQVPTLILKDDRIDLASRLSFFQIYPNPFHLTTTICFNLPVKNKVILKMYDVSGREVYTLIDGELNAGIHRVEFEGRGLPRGIYFYRLDAGSSSVTKKVVLIK